MLRVCCFHREMVRAGDEAGEERWFFWGEEGLELLVGELAALVGGHPVEKPIVGFVFTWDLEVHKELPPEEGGAADEGFAEDGEAGSDANDAEALGVGDVMMSGGLRCGGGGWMGRGSVRL